MDFLLNKSLESLRNSNLESAELYLKQALRLESKNPHVLRLLGVICAQRRQYADALKYLNDSLKAFPNNSLALSNLGNVFHELKEYSNALNVYDRSIKLEPQYEEAWSNKGNALQGLKRYNEAIVHYDEALRLNPYYAEAWSNKGNALQGLKRYDEAIVHYDEALRLNPYYAEAWSNKGNALQGLKRYDEAIAHFDKVLSLQPDYAEAWFSKGMVLYLMARPFDAKKCFEKELEYKPDFYKARWAKLFASIPVITDGTENLQELREEFSFGLEQSREWFQEKNLDKAHEIVGSIQPFYLAYQELNNKQLLNKYGELCCSLMNNWQKIYCLQQSKTINTGKVKLGIVGDQIHNHSVWNAITRGLVFNLDASKFEIHIFHLGSYIDEETYSAKLKSTSFTNNQPSLLDWTNRIIEKNIDVLLYPEISMDLMTTQLACLRLAPLQIASWGHPETTGLPTIDYYLSAELFEDEFSQEAYTETLIKLPNLGTNFSRSLISSVKFDYEKFGINPNEPILICPGTPYKYAPQYDWILAEITKRLGKCKLIFFNYQNNLTEALMLRLEKVFKEANLVLGDYVVFISWLKPEEFYGLMKCADVYLDTIGFSGFNSAMQAVDCALPIVTRKSNFMRGRLASGILKKMAIPELIAKTDEEYVELVVRLTKDRLYRNQIQKRMIEIRDILYDDNQPIHAFENFLLSKVKDPD